MNGHLISRSYGFSEDISEPETKAGYQHLTVKAKISIESITLQLGYLDLNWL